jgi:hypothetical protein
MVTVRGGVLVVGLIGLLAVIGYNAREYYRRKKQRYVTHKLFT